MRLLVSGYRGFTDKKVIKKEISGIFQKHNLDQEKVIIHGGCPTGVDFIADMIAREEKWNTEVFLADWSKYGKSAGPIRNRQMIIEGKPDMAILFLSPQSRGTKNMLTLIEQYKIPHIVINLKD